jgi:hypothetical protein
MVLSSKQKIQPNEIQITDEMIRNVKFHASQFHSVDVGISSITHDVFEQLYGRPMELIEVWDNSDKILNDAVQIVYNKIIEIIRSK